MPFSMHRVPDEDVSFVLADAYKSAGIVIAMPTYEYKMFPPMAYVLDIFERKHVWNRKALRIGSWGWVGGAKKEYDEKVAPLKWTHSNRWNGPARPTRPRSPCSANAAASWPAPSRPADPNGSARPGKCEKENRPR